MLIVYGKPNVCWSNITCQITKHGWRTYAMKRRPNNKTTTTTTTRWGWQWRDDDEMTEQRREKTSAPNCHFVVVLMTHKDNVHIILKVMVSQSNCPVILSVTSCGQGNKQRQHSAAHQQASPLYKTTEKISKCVSLSWAHDQHKGWERRMESSC
jgi:hypothetical protein